MRAILAEHFGGAEAMRADELGIPEPTRDELLVRVLAAGVGPWDVEQRRGEWKGPLPYVPGAQFAGRVVGDTGADAGFEDGAPVYGWPGPGGCYAQYVTCDVERLAPVPAGLRVTDAAAVPVDALTADQGITSILAVKAADRVLITAAAGGLGHFAVQMAHALEAIVVATASPRDHELVHYPRSFADANGDGVGDLRGIAEHLDYLNDGTDSSLGVAAIWLSPFYRSPMADFGYDISDYTDVDPLFGTMEDFDRLLGEAQRRGISVIVDWVPNHTSDQHPWFIESASGRKSAKRDWYVWRDPAPDGGPPNNWQSAFAAVGSAWTFHEATGQYYLHSFMPQQPDLNWDNSEVEAAMHEVLRYWLDRGADGFRIDAIYRLAKDPELRDNEPGIRHDEDWPTIHQRLRKIRAVIDEYENRVIVGEVYLLDLRRLVEYINSGDELHLAHNFVFFHLPWQAAAFGASVQEFTELAGQSAWPAWFLENHDHSRVATRYAAAPGSGQRRARTAAMLICTLRGTPFLYYGQELGLPDAHIPPDRVVDVDGRDPERSPMPWRRPSMAGPGAGFTTAEPWLPVVPDAKSLCVESQQRDPASTLAFVRSLIHLRSREPTLQSGTQRLVGVASDVFCFERELDRRFLIALNFGSNRVPLALGGDAPGPAFLELSTYPGREHGAVDLRDLVLEPDEGLILRLSEGGEGRS